MCQLVRCVPAYTSLVAILLQEFDTVRDLRERDLDDYSYSSRLP
jgi:hypothetical protein